MQSILKTFAAIMLITLYSCKKNGTGGANAIAAFPKHHGVAISSATVYVKYGATELPGTNPSDYDDSKVAQKEGNMPLHVHFENLLRGDYYLYAVGYDSSVAQIVKGGIAVKVTSKSGETDIDIPVTE